MAIKIKLLPLLVLAFSPAAFAITPPNLDAYQQPQIFSNWLLSRCAGRISADKAFTDDAYKSASAWLEKSHLPIEAFNDGDRLINDYLKMNVNGAVKSDFNMMKCTLMSQSQDVQGIINKYKK